MAYIVLWVGRSRGQSVLYFHKVQGCCMDKKHNYEFNLLLFLLNSAFQKVIIAFLHTSITLNS